MKTQWTHPEHARPRSSEFNPRGEPLTDRMIHRYALQGFYGEAARQRALADDEAKERRKRHKTTHVKKTPTVIDL